MLLLFWLLGPIILDEVSFLVVTVVPELLLVGKKNTLCGLVWMKLHGQRYRGFGKVFVALSSIWATYVSHRDHVYLAFADSLINDTFVPRVQLCVTLRPSTLLLRFHVPIIFVNVRSLGCWEYFHYSWIVACSFSLFWSRMPLWVSLLSRVVILVLSLEIWVCRLSMNHNI